ncbi:glycosyltransferase family 4 protein [Pseudohaliea sp.]|uniref:glycosyltransferase family 4 protein n=1 Tax=Pseudohaliea sp. TaxID=2740289 RepID=UPI0032EB64A8
MRVALAIQHYPPYLGGAECQARDLARALAARAHQVEVASTRWSKALPRQEVTSGVAVWRLPVAGPRWLRYPSAFLAGLRAGWRLGGRVDVLHAHCLSAFALGAVLAARRRGVPCLLKLCSTGACGDLARLRRPWLLGLPERILRHVERLVVPSLVVADELAAAGVPASRTLVLPSIFNVPANPRRAMHPPRRALYVGRLHEGKGLRTLMEAWPAVVGRGLQLVLVGDGPLHDELAAWARSPAVAGSVELAGYRADPTVYYRGADLFLFPSRSESFGNVIVEAMLHGLPVLTTAVGVVAEWSAEAPVYRLPADDVGAWRSALQAAAAGALDPGLGESARRFACRHYAQEPVLAGLERVYRDLVEARGLSS